MARRAQLTEQDFRPAQAEPPKPLALLPSTETPEDLERELVRVENRLAVLHRRHLVLRLRLGR